MKKRHALKATLALSTSLVSFASLAHAGGFNVVPGDLKGALDSYAKQAGIALAYREDAVVGVRTKGVVGDVTPGKALNRILSGTGFIARQHASGAITIVRDVQALNAPSENLPMLTLAQATAAPHAVETVTVTSSKLGGVDVQSIPISITALSQEQLTASQTNGGPDLVKQVPNLTFTKTNFSGYSIQIRGIGTQAISVTTDPAVAIAFNDTPFIRNHFFEQEFFDVAQVEILRGPQGTLYGRNATAGVVNITSAKPSDQFEAMVSGELGNYQSRRFEGMVNIPIVDDRVAIRIAGEWTKRKGYSFNELTDSSIDGRNLWSGRVTVGWKPMEKLQTYLIWEHFSEDDDRLRSSKQLCKTDPIPTSVGGQPVPLTTAGVFNVAPYLSQSCQMVSLYSPEAFQVPNGFSLPYYLGPQFNGLMNNTVDPYSRTTQSSDLRRIESQFTPDYGVKSNVVELSNTYEVSPSLTFVSETSFSNDFLRSTQDYNRFNTAPGVFTKGVRGMGTIGPITNYLIDRDGVFCDPQLGCSDRLLAMDMVVAKSWQAGQELRITSHFTGPFNFSFGGNYLHYETDENYYVFINSLTAFSWAQGGSTSEFPRGPWVPGVSDNSGCLLRYGGFKYYDPTKGGGSPNVNACTYIDPNPVTNLNDKGHNYFLSQNPYTLNSFAAFGESYYEILSDLKATV
ncbi:MAG TPA: TonB-dependent receptor plug domain-containing protein, partial [Rhizomicrobium sp.]|nr:TonB-dependent receptor plug domain-containing protein [Rhizomicrobium sp.]